MSECDHCNVDRREFLRRGAVGGLALAVASQFGFIHNLLARDGSGRGAKACILVWLSGGPSQIDTFDPKPGTDTGGEFRALETSVRGVYLSEVLPRLAAGMKRFSIIRSLSSPEGDHGRAAYLLHTGYRPRASFPHPTMGTVFSHELAEDKAFPKFVAIGSTPQGSSSFFDPTHGPFMVSDPATALESIKTIAQGKRVELMKSLQSDYLKSHAGEDLARREVSVEFLRKLLDTPFAKAMDLSSESDQIKKDYGENPFGQGCLLARRLVESGVKFVEVELGGWDTHNDNFNAVRQLCGQLDPALSTLLRDLDERGLLKDTLVLCMGEFGRTPQINKDRGRDHFPDITPVAIAGGSIQGGRVIGETGKTGTEIVRDRVQAPDLFATIYEACGIDTRAKFFNRDGGLVKSTDNGTLIRDLF